ncbi:hypothetical protein RFI_13628 [Reticulomyxa filosa]|uniref:Uncharacterized protein n=1 Tax=Reticulomyxa filosa TaxID=46433 RepID=X6NB88_RETFI|nr:hypothetical protein RFI_13628 [Reticulomyxa filosa]|eukprot:ETO23550.1 hypothetical protein RFI_13628 [Reticulomyxa filosa]
MYNRINNISVVDLTEELSQTSIEPAASQSVEVMDEKRRIRKALGDIANIILYDAALLVEAKRSEKRTKVLAIIMKSLKAPTDIKYIEEQNRMNLHTFLVNRKIVQYRNRYTKRNGEFDDIIKEFMGIEKVVPWQNLEMMKAAKDEVTKIELMFAKVSKLPFMVMHYSEALSQENNDDDDNN